VLASEGLREAGIMAMLETSSAVSLQRFSPSEHSDVVIVDLPRIVAETLRPLKLSNRRYGSVAVAIVNEDAEIDVGAAADGGIVSIMHPVEASPDALLLAVGVATGETQTEGMTSPWALTEQMARVRERGAQQSPGVDLSEREVALLRYLAEGLETNEIMHRMHVSERTVKYIIWCVMQRYSLHNRVHAVAFAIRAGVI
jgi:DNA-binding NarL/FixJ family response regulator